MQDDLKAKLERFLPIRMVVRIHEGVVQGRIEHSFNMDWDSECINVFWSGKAYSIIGEHQLNGVKWANDNLNKFDINQFVIDPLAEDSPIEVDWEKWLAATDKFNKRNAPFVVKPHGAWQLQALAAKRQYNELKLRYDSMREVFLQEQEINNKIRAILIPEEVEENED